MDGAATRKRPAKVAAAEPDPEEVRSADAEALVALVVEGDLGLADMVQ
jgi:hypothetical protein